MQRFDAEQITAVLESVDSIGDCKRFLQLASRKVRGFTQVNANCYVAMGFEYKLLSSEDLDRERRALTIARDLKVKAAPQIISSRLIGSVEEVGSRYQGLLVTCFEGCRYRQVDPVSCQWPVIPAAARSALVSDFDRLATHGFLHPLAISGFTNWHLHPDRNLVLLDQWGGLREIENRELTKLAETLAKLWSAYDERRVAEGLAIAR